jgi:hypothetical protein
MPSAILVRAREQVPNWVAEPSFLAYLVVLIAAQAIYFVVRGYLEYRVRRYHLGKYIMDALSYE